MEARIPSKLFLFGEYLVLLGASAFAIPFDSFGGQFIQGDSSDAKLKDYFKSLKNEAPQLKLDWDGMEQDFNTGLRFESTIPMGYGLGSSAALVVAIYKRYYLGDPQTDQILQATLAKMEAPFHGKSSGFDPFVIFKNKAYIRSSSKLKSIVFDQSTLHTFNCFLLDAGKPRVTAGLVPSFLERSKQTDFAKQLEQKCIPLNEELIHLLVQGNTALFMEKIWTFSELQHALFNDMIPTDIAAYWKKGLDSRLFALKLCGAGGGGFFLGFGNPTESPYQITFL